MRSGTSFFNSTLYRKTMHRFWPLWTLYGLIWLFALPLNMLNRYFDNLRWGVGAADTQHWMLTQATDVPGLLTFGVIMAVGFSVLCAMAAFGYLYNNRSAAMFHALPLRREALFTTQYLAGLSFLLLPNLAVAALTAAVEMATLAPDAWGVALKPLLIWLLAQSGVCLFFFSFASFCATFTGHILALPAFYGILNFLVLALYELVIQLAQQFYYGFFVSGSNDLVAYCTPAAYLMEACRWDLFWKDGVQPSSRHLYSPGAVAVYAAVGLVFAVLALMVYQRRHVESAGDVVAIHIVRPIFKYGVAICAGLAMGMFTASFFGWSSNALYLSLCLLLWAVVGYFAAEMLLKKSFRVFRAWKGCAVMTVLLAVLCFACFQDFFGVESRVPAPDQVQSVTILSGPHSYPLDDGQNDLPEITDPQLIRQFIALHQAIVTDPRRNSDHASADDYTSFNLYYQLKDGSSLRRRYFSVPLFRNERDQEGSVTWCAQQLIQNRTLTALRYDFDSFEKGQLVSVQLQGVYDKAVTGITDAQLKLDSAQELMELWRAVRQDFDEGTIGVRYLFEDQERHENTYRTDLCFTWMMTAEDPMPKDDDPAKYARDFTITLTPNARHTLDWLASRDVWGDQLAPASQDYAPAAMDEWEQSRLGASIREIF